MSSKKSSAPSKPSGKQTTLFGFFQKANGSATGKEKERVEARAKAPLTPLPSSEIGEQSPVRVTIKKKTNGTGGLRTPETPTAEKSANEMEMSSQTGSTGSRRVYCS
jgi:hypothetical protein